MYICLCACLFADCQKREDVLENEIVKLVRDTIGPVAAFKKVIFVKALPKTRSGKIPRSSLANLVNHKPYKVLSELLFSLVITVSKLLYSCKSSASVQKS